MAKKIGRIVVVTCCLMFMISTICFAESWEKIHTGDGSADSYDSYIDWDSAWYDNDKKEGGATLKYIGKSQPQYYTLITQTLNYIRWEIRYDDMRVYDNNGKFMMRNKKYHWAVLCPEDSNGRDYMIAFRNHFGDYNDDEED